MLSGVVLYYVPESRPHARRICYALIDLTANGLKSALSTRESGYMYEKIKSKYQRARYEQLLQKRMSQDTQDEDSDRAQKNYGRQSKMFLEDDGVLGSKKLSGKQNKEHRHSGHRFRNGVIKDVPPEPCMEVTKPVYFYSDKLEDIEKYLETNSSSGKRVNESSVENYALLISGSPREMAILDEKYEKDDLVIVQDPYLKVEYKECGTSTDKLSSKAEASSSEQEGPTRDHSDHVMESYVKEVELNSIPEENTSRYSVDKSLYQTSQYQCGGGCCGPSGCSMSSGEPSNKEAVDSTSPVDVKNILKASRSTVSPKIHKKVEENEKNSYTSNYSNYSHKGKGSAKTINSTNSRRVDFQEEDTNDRVKNPMQRSGHRYESTSRGYRKKLRNDDSPRTGFCRNNTSYFTDRGGEADDENSQTERATTRHDLDERPQRENHFYRKSSTDSIFDYYDDIYAEPMLKNRLKPTLLRAINWIFGGCPEASRRAALKRSEVGKEESQGLTDEWLL
ncbi:PREDICTED: uncharacterized protein LOC108570422 [Habropoda laboriosa]|uniref:uncharacterized protein LOC108570422 n=1 Tax=Habropoda laboriosa TaxID=597456 RepID=UPI00083CBA35|nr:PREDICTED: uncharacterized protein LOC108570422 [Habropoda laboriosa]